MNIKIWLPFCHCVVGAQQLMERQILTRNCQTQVDGSDSKCCLVFRRPASDIVWGFSRLLAKLYEPATAKYLDHTQLIRAISKNILQTVQIQSWWWAVSPPSELSSAFRSCATKLGFLKITSWHLACCVFFSYSAITSFLAWAVAVATSSPKRSLILHKVFHFPTACCHFQMCCKNQFNAAS